MDPVFLFGASTSSHQVEGGNQWNDWWAWEKAGKLKYPSGKACDQYRLFREDIALIEKLGHNAHRFSIEWSRIEPLEGRWNDEALHHYEEFVKELVERGIEPVVTLHHFTNPTWFNDLGGWLQSNNVRYFVRYVERVVSTLGKYVRYWITINEPLIYIYHGYFTAVWPPGYKSFEVSMRVFHSLVEAHLRSYRTIHRLYSKVLHRPVAVSAAKHMSCFSPCRETSWFDHLAVFLRNWFFNDSFFQAVWKGFAFFPGMLCHFYSSSRALDFLAVNYYARDFIRFAGFGEDATIGDICDKEHHRAQVRETNMLGWEVYPEGLYHVIMRLRRYALPVMITENGICTEDDDQRQRFIRNHLEAAFRAAREGLPLLGYLHWSLLDNFEWAEGFSPRFGIVEVDFGSQTRKIRPSAQVLSHVCRNYISKA